VTFSTILLCFLLREGRERVRGAERGEGDSETEEGDGERERGRER